MYSRCNALGNDDTRNILAIGEFMSILSIDEKREKRNLYMREWRKLHLEQSREIDRKFKRTHRDLLRKKAIANYQKNGDSIREYQKIHSKLPHVRERNMKRLRSLWLKQKYGITQSEYLEIFRKQNGQCAICGVSHLELNRPLCVDHDHVSKKVRGLLCVKCNMGIGDLNDDILLLEKATEYLKHHSQKEAVVS